MFAPAMLLGVIGGLMGATFTIMNLKINDEREEESWPKWKILTYRDLWDGSSRHLSW